MTGPVPALEPRPDAPKPECVEEVAKWEDPDGSVRTELIYAPVFWVLLPLAVLGYLIRGTITAPGDGWTGNLFDDDSTGQLWNFWIVWVGVGIWLLVAIGVLILRASIVTDVRADNRRILEHGVPHTVHHSPYDADDGEGGSWPTFIAIDHRATDEQAARLHQALRAWLSCDEVREALGSGSPRERSPIASTELFGEEAEGGYFLSSIPGSGPVGHSTAPEWVLITPPRDEDDAFTVTVVPREKKLQKIRRKLHRRAARRSAS